MKTSHTPGPWDISKIGNPYEQYLVYATTDNRGPSLCQSVEGEANARLIAAAPDLLSACQAALDLLQDGDAEPCDADSVTAILVAAIDRAARN